MKIKSFFDEKENDLRERHLDRNRKKPKIKNINDAIEVMREKLISSYQKVKYKIKRPFKFNVPISRGEDS